MRGFWVSVVALAGIIAALPASTAPVLRNVSGFDTGLLVGKTCEGVFNSGRRREGSQGALQLRFVIRGDVLTADFWRRLGKSEYDRYAYAITQPGRGSPVPDLDYWGPVSNLTVAGATIQYVDPTGGKVQLTYDNGRLRGRSDPRGGTEWHMTRVSNVELVCV